MKEMKEDEIEVLLQKYYKGETTLQEEKLLKTYVNQNNSSSDFKSEQQWFKELQQEKQAEISKGFDQRMAEKLEQVAVMNKTQTKLRPLFALPYRIAAVLAIALGLSFVIYFTLSRKQSQWVEVSTIEKETKQVSLPDGSKVWLNGASKIRYVGQWQASTHREVWLEGEAYFEVAHNPQQPFRVYMAGAVTQVLGTSFNVRGYMGEPTAEIGVISGKVSFAAQANESAGKLILQPGYGAVFNKTRITIQKNERNNPNLLAWKTHQLIFEDTPLHEVIAALERYFAIEIELKSTGLVNCRFKGSFKEAKLEEVLEVMQFSMNISAQLKDGKYIFSGKGCL
jgi:ferric-dicitrate binding protein FerR (iron transport regulator)